MEFALSEDQSLLQSAVAGVLTTASPLDTVRAVADGESGAGDGLQAAVSELGLAGMLVPEESGGLGLGLLEAALVQEQIGAAVAPVPFLARSVMAVAALNAAEKSGEAQNWLAGILSGEVRFGVGLMEHVGAREGAGLDSSSGRLSGKTLFNLDMDNATHVLTADRQGIIHIVDLAADGLSRRGLQTIDRTRTCAEIIFEDVASVKLTDVTDGRAAVERVILAGRLMVAADTLGAAQAMLDNSVAYASERKQFGRVIGSFQAVKHMCAEMAAEIEPARALIWHAAHALDEGMDEAPVMACLAKSHLSEIGTFVARTATEVHGGMGFTDLVGLHYWFKRIGANRQLLGSPEQVRDEAARLQGWA